MMTSLEIEKNNHKMTHLSVYSKYMAQGEYQEALACAARFGRIEEIKEAIAAGAHVDIRSGSLDRNALMDAAFWGNTPAVDYLRGLIPPAAIDSQGVNALMLAARNGQKGCVKLLLEVMEKEEVLKGSPSGSSSLELALYSKEPGALGCAQEILRKSVGLSHQKAMEYLKGMVHIPESTEGFDELAVALIAGLPKECLVARANGALAEAAAKGCVRLIKLLIEVGGADPQSRDDNERTPLMLAAKNGAYEAMEYLAPLSDLSAQSNIGFTALAYACSRGSPEGIELLAPGSDRALILKDGWTPIALVANSCNNDTGLERALRALGPQADMWHKTMGRWTPLAMSAMRGGFALEALINSMEKTAPSKAALLREISKAEGLAFAANETLYPQAKAAAQKLGLHAEALLESMELNIKMVENNKSNAKGPLRIRGGL